jgi:hypothetical protein
MTEIKNYKLITLTNFAKLIDMHPVALRSALLKKPDNYPALYKGKGKNSPYKFRELDVIEWIESQKIK